MKRKTIYVDEVSGKRFDKSSKASESERRSRKIKQAFSFYGREDGSCDFANGSYCYQRDKVFYFKLVDTLVDMVKKYEPWIAKQYGKYGGLKREDARGYSFLGRYLDDGDSDLYYWWGIQGNICPIRKAKKFTK